MKNSKGWFCWKTEKKGITDIFDKTEIKMMRAILTISVKSGQGSKGLKLKKRTNALPEQ